MYVSTSVCDTERSSLSGYVIGRCSGANLQSPPKGVTLKWTNFYGATLGSSRASDCLFQPQMCCLHTRPNIGRSFGFYCIRCLPISADYSAQRIVSLVTSRRKMWFNCPCTVGYKHPGASGLTHIKSLNSHLVSPSQSRTFTGIHTGARSYQLTIISLTGILSCYLNWAPIPTTWAT